jgi:hypothetical protein
MQAGEGIGPAGIGDLIIYSIEIKHVTPPMSLHLLCRALPLNPRSVMVGKDLPSLHAVSFHSIHPDWHRLL